MTGANRSFRDRNDSPGIEPHADAPQLLGHSAAMAWVREFVARVGPTEAPVLVTGEIGTGKELAARALHAASPRASHGFVAVDCAALPAGALDRALFTKARGGTLFLDDVGEASPEVQSRLLRALQEWPCAREGVAVDEPVDVRVIAATHRDLRADVLAGRFRKDLYYRLRVVPLAMPPLRDRVEDLALLAASFLARAAARHGARSPGFDAGALAALAAHHWPGNVRELAHVVEAAALLAGEREVRAEHLRAVMSLPPGVTAAATTRAPDAPAPLAGDVSTALGPALASVPHALPPLRNAREAFERAYLVELLRRADGNVTAAARTAGRNRTDLYDLLRRHGLAPADFKAGEAPRASGGRR